MWSDKEKWVKERLRPGRRNWISALMPWVHSIFRAFFRFWSINRKYKNKKNKQIEMRYYSRVPAFSSMFVPYLFIHRPYRKMERMDFCSFAQVNILTSIVLRAKKKIRPFFHSEHAIQKENRISLCAYPSSSLLRIAMRWTIIVCKGRRERKKIKICKHTKHTQRNHLMQFSPCLGTNKQCIWIFANRRFFSTTLSEAFDVWLYESRHLAITCATI